MFEKERRKKVTDSLLIFLTDMEFTKISFYAFIKSKKRKTICNKSWYNHTLPLYDDIQFRSTFRMNRACMKFILHAFFRVANIEDTFDNVKHFHMLIYYAMYNISYRAVEEKFGERVTKTFTVITQLMKCFNTKMGPIYISLPDVEEMNFLAAQFASISNINGTILAIDGTHMPIEAPKHMDFNYINRKGRYSINFQLVVDFKYIIRDVYGGFPGSCHDGHVFSCSSFKDYVLNDIPSPYFVIGDGAYTNFYSLVTPFKGILTNDQELFKNRHSLQRMRVEGTRKTERAI